MKSPTTEKQDSPCALKGDATTLAEAVAKGLWAVLAAPKVKYVPRIPQNAINVCIRCKFYTYTYTYTLSKIKK